MVDLLGDPVGFFLTGGKAHNPVGTDYMLPSLQANALIADTAFDADKRVVEPLAAVGKTAAIPSKTNRRSLRDYDRLVRDKRHRLARAFSCGT